MVLLRSKSSMWFLVVVTAHVTEALGKPRLRLKLTDDEERVWSPDSWRHTQIAGPEPAAGPEPGDPAAAFRVPTLDGEFSYQPGGLQGSLVIHAFTNKSGFLECLWSSEASLSSLVQDLPNSTHVLFLSLDDSAVSDALWMRGQLQRAAMHR